MPRLLKDPKERGLYRDPRTGIYYVRKYVSGKGELTKSLGEKNRHKAIQAMNQILAYWLGRTTKHGHVLFDRAALEVLELKKMQAPKTTIDYADTLRLHLLPYFSGKPLNEVGRLWSRYKAHQRKLTPKRKLKHDRKHLRFILGYAYEQEWIDGIPILKLDRVDRVVERGREYTNQEYSRLMSIANPAWALKIDLGITVGMRRNEIRLLRWDYIDWVRGLVILPSQVIKTREDRIFALDDIVLKRLKERFAFSGSPYVFPNRVDPMRPESNTDKTWQRMKRKLGISGKFHWLRHTAATRSIREGHSDTIVQSSLGMSSQVMKRVYVHSSLEDLKAIPRSVRKTLPRKRSTRKDSETGVNRDL